MEGAVGGVPITGPPPFTPPPNTPVGGDPNTAPFMVEPPKTLAEVLLGTEAVEVGGWWGPPPFETAQLTPPLVVSCSFCVLNSSSRSLRAAYRSSEGLPGAGEALVVFGVEEEVVEVLGVSGVRGLLENGRWGPEGAGRPVLAVGPDALFTKILAFSKLAKEACDTGAAWGPEEGVCLAVGEAKGSPGGRVDRVDWPRSERRSNEAEGRGPGSLVVLLLLLGGGGLVMLDRLLPLLLTDPSDWDAGTLGLDTDEVVVVVVCIVAPAAPLLAVSLPGVEAAEEEALVSWLGGMILRATLGSM